MQWCYVPTELNPADYLTRGLRVPELIEQRSWWEGPQYLHEKGHHWPETKLLQVSEQAKQEVKRRYFDLSSQSGFTDRKDSEFDGEDSTMVMFDTSNQPWSWRLDPECFSN